MAKVSVLRVCGRAELPRDGRLTATAASIFPRKRPSDRAMSEVPLPSSSLEAAHGR